MLYIALGKDEISIAWDKVLFDVWGLFIFFYWFSVSDNGIIFKGVDSSISISMYFIPLASMMIYTKMHLMLVFDDILIG